MLTQYIKTPVDPLSPTLSGERIRRRVQREKRRATVRKLRHIAVFTALLGGLIAAALVLTFCVIAL